MNPLLLENRNVLVIAGPTAVGKTAVALALADHLRCEIIGADARQVYRTMDIGTAKPTAEEQSRVHHYCIDIRDPHESYSAAEYASDARAAISSVALDTLPIMVGGSGLYISAALDGLSTGGTASDPSVRDELQRDFDERGRESMFLELEDLDPRAAQRYADRNPRRVQRALEFIRITGRPFSSTWDLPRDSPGVNALYVCISQDQRDLHTLIHSRCENMWASGLLQETKDVLDLGVTRSAQSLHTVGYHEALAVIDGVFTEQEAIAAMKTSTRRYAKRQRTWFAKDDRYTWLSGPVDTMTKQVLALLDRNSWLQAFVDLHNSR